MTKATKETALAAYDSSAFAVIAQEDSCAMLADAFQQLQIGQFNLHKLKCPSGGGTAWEVSTLAGPEAVQDLKVVLALTKGNQRAWNATPYEESGGGSPPDCSSTDGVTGYGNNTLDAEAERGEHKCAQCHWAQFGSSRGQGAGQDCRQTATILVFQENSIMPMRLSVPPTSLGNLQQYFMDLLGAARRPAAVVTSLTLEKAKSEGGTLYSKIVFRHAGDLSKEAAEKIKAVTDVVGGVFKDTVHRETTTGEGAEA
jgi:hypothetical protein